MEELIRQKTSNSIIACTTKKTDIHFLMKSNTDIFIDWGDGTGENIAHRNTISTVQKKYTSSDLHQIIIKGEVTYLNCKKEQLITLDVSKCTALNELNCCNNQLTTLNISKNTALTELDCRNNQLTALDVSKNTDLTKLYCIGNQLTSLDISNNAKLTNLACSNNLLRELNINNNRKLSELSINDNCFVSNTANQLYESLSRPPIGVVGDFFCDNIGKPYLAKGKGWRIYVSYRDAKGLLHTQHL